MPAEPATPADRTNPGRSRIGVLVLRLGVLGVFVAALGVSLVSFALFGCACFGGHTVRKTSDPPPYFGPPIVPHEVQPPEETAPVPPVP